MKISFYIQPGAKKSELAGKHNGMIKIRIAAPPVEGSANKALLEFLAAYLKAPKSAFGIISGEKSRLKTVDIDESRIGNLDNLKHLTNL